MSDIHLVTGATGFVGGAITLELLGQTDAEVVCIVRSTGGLAAAQDRLATSLIASARAFGRQDLSREIHRRCRAVPGDILQPICGVAADAVGRVSEVWHCAASLKYEEENRSEILAHNVGGTEHVLSLARRINAPIFNYISTAYVAGSRSGRILETLPSIETPTNNFYEKSKIMAELRVDAAEGHHTRILRPSIVIGDSQTLAATSFTGLYGFMSQLTKFKNRVARRLGGYLSHRALRIWADEHVPVNLIPVDVLARNAVRISRSRSSANIFHLTNDCPTPVGESMPILFSALGLRAPRFVSSCLEFTSLDEALDRAIQFYRSYLSHAKIFDRTNADAVLGVDAAASHVPVRGERLLSFIRWYLAHTIEHTRVVRPYRATPVATPSRDAEHDEMTIPAIG
jgi:nucleoside-diphosphate-sugar epimerase